MDEIQRLSRRRQQQSPCIVPATTIVFCGLPMLLCESVQHVRCPDWHYYFRMFYYYLCGSLLRQAIAPWVTPRVAAIVSITMIAAEIIFKAGLIEQQSPTVMLV